MILQSGGTWLLSAMGVALREGRTDPRRHARPDTHRTWQLAGPANHRTLL